MQLQGRERRVRLELVAIVDVEAAGQDLAPYESYLEAFKHGMPPHGGFAIGWERWMARLVEASNVRETTLFPRDINRLAP